MMAETAPDRIEEIESLARHNCDELAGLTAALEELRTRVAKLEGVDAAPAAPQNCPTCRGSGFIRDYWHPYWDNGYTETDCTACGGTGKLTAGGATDG